MNDTAAGPRKSAILLMALGEDRAAAVLNQFDPSEVEVIGLAMAKLGQVSKEELATVLDEFRFETEQLSALHLDSGSYVRAVLKKALGEDMASHLLDDIMRAELPRGGIARLNRLEVVEVMELMRNEHPQIIATLLVHLDRQKAADVLEKLPVRLRDDVVLRVATFGGVQPQALQELTDVLTQMLSGDGMRRSHMGGVRAAAEMVNLMGTSTEEEVLAHVRDEDEALAQRIADEMFVFEDLLEVDDNAIQRILKDVESESLVIALKTATAELRDRFFSNMAQRAAESLREELEMRGPVRVSRVEAEQRSILQIVRNLADSGEIVISNSGGDELVT
jgi:flagellar motor switch protein FliG